MAVAKPQGRCLFCHRTGLSKEHVWAAWMAPHLREAAGVEMEGGFSDYHFRHEDGVGEFLRPLNSRPSDMSSLKARIVCEKCNNGWMSRLETAVSTVLTPLIKGQPATLYNDDQRLLARWIVKTAIVIEGRNKIDLVTTRTERSIVMNNNRPPANWRIWIGNCESPLWSVGAERTSVTVQIGGFPRPSGRNMQSITFGVGRLLVHATSSKAPIRMRFIHDVSDVLYQLWPVTRTPLLWPPPRVLSDEQADNLARSLGRHLVQSGAFESVPELKRVPKQE